MRFQMTTAALDNDILFKGACYGLLERFVAVIPAELHQTGFLGAAPFVLRARLQKVALSKAPEEVLEQLQSLFKMGVALEPTPDETKIAADIEFAAQRNNLGLDAGESQLCAIVITREIQSLITGDKRAIRALESLLLQDERVKILSGKVICLEQLAVRAINEDGPAAIRNSVCSEIEVDRSLAISFECSNPNPSPDVGLAGLQSYIEDLRKTAKTLLVA